MDAWRVKRALESFRSLLDVVEQLTEEEVYHCLKLETETQRRQTVIDRLIAKAADFNRQSFIANLKEKIHGTSKIGSTDEGRKESRRD